jgi:hypothetical protein
MVFFWRRNIIDTHLKLGELHEEKRFCNIFASRGGGLPFFLQRRPLQIRFAR